MRQQKGEERKEGKWMIVGWGNVRGTKGRDKGGKSYEL